MVDIYQEGPTLQKGKDFDVQRGYRVDDEIDKTLPKYLGLVENIQREQARLGSDVKGALREVVEFEREIYSRNCQLNTTVATLEKEVRALKNKKSTPHYLIDTDTAITISLIVGGMLVSLVGALKDILYFPHLGVVAGSIGVWHLLIKERRE